MARVNILQTLVLFSLLIQIVSDGSDKPMIDVTLAKSESVRNLGFEDRSCFDA